MEGMKSECAVVVGVGHIQGIGAAVARRCINEGMPVYIVGRNKAKLDATATILQASGGEVKAVTLDATQPDQLRQLFEQIHAEGRQAVLVVHNVGNNWPSRILKTTPAFLEEMWRLCFLSGLNVGQEAVRHMLKHGKGTLLFTGASASLRGNPLFAPFASGKAALRALAFGMAGEFEPHGIHVAHVIIDGIVNGDKVSGFAAGIGGAALLLSKGQDGALHPDDIAENYWHLHKQPRGLWTRELDLRPFKEKF